MSDDTAATDLIRSLQAIARSQRRWLDDVVAVTAGDPRFPDAFRRWEEWLTLIKLHLHRSEQRLLHYLMVPDDRRGWSQLGTVAPDARATWRQWYDRIAPYLRSLHIEHHYRRVGDVLDPGAEATTADAITDLVTVAEVADTTGHDLRRLDLVADQAEDLEHLAFYHVLGPWRQQGLPALLDLQRWMRAWLNENHDV